MKTPNAHITTTATSQAPNGQALGIAKTTTPAWVAQLRADPDGFQPTAPEHLIGPARDIATKILRIGQSLRDGNTGSNKILLHGPTGTGKTRIADMFCKVLTDQEFSIVEYAGATLNKDTVAEWKKSMQYKQSGIRVIHIDEIEHCSQEAKYLLKSLLNNVPRDWVFVATTNADPRKATSQDNKAFWTRFRWFDVQPPTKVEMEQWLEKTIGLRDAEARSIARNAQRSVRLAQNLLVKYLS